MPVPAGAVPTRAGVRVKANETGSCKSPFDAANETLQQGWRRLQVSCTKFVTSDCPRAGDAPGPAREPCVSIV